MAAERKIIRKGYRRKAYVRADGTRVRAVYVKPRLIKDVGLPGHGKKLFTLKKGLLTKHGYVGVEKLNQIQRRAALRRALREMKALSLFRRLNALYVLNKNKKPALARKVKADRDWVREKLGR